MIRFYNTLTKQKEEFTPLEGNTVRMYSCGPTVYKDATIGNMRTNIFMDTLRRVLKYNGYNLKHVMNITDVGHLVSDGDEGEDKMIKSAREEKKTPLEIAEHYTKLFFRDLERLNIDLPEIIAKATDNIPDMIEFVKKLIQNGYAYETSTAIYFDVSKLDAYGILSGIDVRNQKAGARVEVDKEKRNPYDFAVWIKAPENHLMKWDSPWGLSYPGWHIECSTMSQKFLGEVFDIHTGGIDLIPTHHENEIAQSKGGMDAAATSLARLQEGYYKHLEGNKTISQEVIQEYKQKFLEAINDDLNMPLAMSVVWDVVKQPEKSKQYADLLLDFDKVLGLRLQETQRQETTSLELPPEIEELLQKRKEARERKDWAMSDSIRDALKEKGYQVIDSKEGMKVEKIK